jgi:hypothetical protein
MAVGSFGMFVAQGSNNIDSDYRKWFADGYVLHLVLSGTGSSAGTLTGDTTFNVLSTTGVNIGPVVPTLYLSTHLGGSRVDSDRGIVCHPDNPVPEGSRGCELESRAIALVALSIKQTIVHTVVSGLLAKRVVLNLVLIWREGTGDEVAPEPRAPGAALLCFRVLFASLASGGGVGDLHYSIRVMGHDL